MTASAPRDLAQHAQGLALSVGAALVLPSLYEIRLYLRNNGLRRSLLKGVTAYVVGRQRWYLTHEDLIAYMGQPIRGNGFQFRRARLGEVPHMKGLGHGKIIQLSGGGATNPLPFISAYAASKAAIVRYAETLAEEVRDAGIDVNCIAPGALNTRLLDEVLVAGPEKVGKSFYERAMKQKESGGAPLEVGARLATFLASSDSDGITGKLISAVWDPWNTFTAHIAELSDTDVYTLRRIVPADRGMDWGKA